MSKKRILIKRSKTKYWNGLGWTPYRSNAREFKHRGGPFGADKVATQLADDGIACGVVEE